MNRSPHEIFLQQALWLAEENASKASGPFGAVIVKQNQVIAKAVNTVAVHNDPTAHAEINAIRLGAKSLESFDLSGCILYASCEPCPMCLGAIYWAKIDAVYYANTSKDAEDAGFADAKYHNEFQKGPKEKSLKQIHIPIKNATKAFEIWNDLPEKITY